MYIFWSAARFSGQALLDLIKVVKKQEYGERLSYFISCSWDTQWQEKQCFLDSIIKSPNHFLLVFPDPVCPYIMCFLGFERHKRETDPVDLVAAHFLHASLYVA